MLHNNFLKKRYRYIYRFLISYFIILISYSQKKCCTLVRNFYRLMQLFHGRSHSKIDVALISGGRQEIDPWSKPNRIIHLFLVSPVAARRQKTSRHSLQSSNLRRRAALRGIAKTRKFETFNKRAQKEGAGDPGNCKTTSALASTFIMSTLNVTPFGNRPARRASAFWNTQRQPSALPDSRIPFAIPRCLRRNTGDSAGRRIPFALANRFLSSDFL